MEAQQQLSPEPPNKPARNSSLRRQPPPPTPPRERALSAGFSLNSNANFYDIPVSDAFNDLIEAYLPPNERPPRGADRDAKDLKTMVMSNMWRSIAKYARQQIVQSEPSQTEAILRLWYIRILALTKLGLCQLASAEFEKLGDFDRPELCDPHTKKSLVPFELRVLFAILPSYLKYPTVALERITLLIAYCKRMQTMAQQSERHTWEQRELQTQLVLATQWIQMRDYTAAAEVLKRVLKRAPENADLLCSLGRLYLQMGDLRSANELFQRINEDKDSQTTSKKEATDMNKALELMAEGKWSEARDTLQTIYQNNNSHFVAVNNLAVCEVYLGSLVKAIEILEAFVANNPTSACNSETTLMNLCTLYELRFEDSTPKKVGLLKQVAHWAGDSFQPACLKLHQ